MNRKELVEFLADPDAGNIPEGHHPQGGKKFLPAGRHEIDGPPISVESGQIIIGDGSGTILAIENQPAALYFNTIAGHRYPDDTVVRDLCIESAHGDGIAIHPNSSESAKLVVDNVIFNTRKWGVNFGSAKPTYFSTVSDCTFRSCGACVNYLGKNPLLWRNNLSGERAFPFDEAEAEFCIRDGWNGLIACGGTEGARHKTYYSFRETRLEMLAMHDEPGEYSEVLPFMKLSQARVLTSHLGAVSAGKQIWLQFKSDLIVTGWMDNEDLIERSIFRDTGSRVMLGRTLQKVGELKNHW